MTEEQLSDVLSEFAHTLLTDFPIQGILDHLVGRIVDILPIDAAGVTLISPRTAPRFVAASDDTAMRFEKLQSQLGQGPCMAAYETAQPISIPHLGQDDRFPVFAEKALAGGLVGVFTFPLREGEHCLGALDLYRTSEGDLGAREMSAAQTLADVATAYLLNAQARVDLKASSETEHAAVERLRALDQARNEFVATVSHELRTPMTSITGYVELLQDRDGGQLSPEQSDFVDAIRRNSDRLTALANDLLTLSSLEPGVPATRHLDVDLGEVLFAAASSMASVLAGRCLELTLDAPPEPVIVKGDARHLERLVLNLLTNAVKFTPDRGWVKCVLQQQRRHRAARGERQRDRHPRGRAARAVHEVLPLLDRPRARHPGVGPRPGHRPVDRPGPWGSGLRPLLAHAGGDVHRRAPGSAGRGGHDVSRSAPRPPAAASGTLARGIVVRTPREGQVATHA